jgi:hypothetical protein
MPFPDNCDNNHNVTVYTTMYPSMPAFLSPSLFYWPIFLSAAKLSGSTPPTSIKMESKKKGGGSRDL